MTTAPSNFGMQPTALRADDRARDVPEQDSREQTDYGRNVPIADVVAEVVETWHDMYHPSFRPSRWRSIARNVTP